jgi:cytochrome c oxidase subunit 1
MPRRIAEYGPGTGWQLLNQISTGGAYLLFISVALTLANFWVSWRKPVAAGDNPWDAHTLEWGTSSPPPHHNFYWIPPIRSERPVWDYNHPEHLSIDPHGDGHAPAKQPASAGSASVRIVSPDGAADGKRGSE